MTAETTDTASTATTGVVLTDPAADKVKTLLAQEGRDDLALRVAVQPGGCSGLRYQLFFDERSLDGDSVQEYADGAVRVVVDRMSVPYLAGATIDFVDTIEKQGFTIDNPTAGGSCACGDSFHKQDRVRRRRPREGPAPFRVSGGSAAGRDRGGEDEQGRQR